MHPLKSEWEKLGQRIVWHVDQLKVQKWQIFMQISTFKLAAKVREVVSKPPFNWLPKRHHHKSLNLIWDPRGRR
jgi:hypothetical protein